MNEAERICVDFDGVIHSYTSGWLGIDVIPDPIVPYALPTLWNYLSKYKVAIYSARSGQKGGIKAMKAYIDREEKKWLKNSVLQTDAEIDRRVPLIRKLEFPKTKPIAFLYIDDRGFRFKGVFPSLNKIAQLSTTWIDQAKANLEAMAYGQHDAWSAHVKNLIDNYEQSDGSIVIPKDKVESWRNLTNTHYANLPDEEQQKDRDVVYDHFYPSTIVLTDSIAFPPREEHAEQAEHEDIHSWEDEPKQEEDW